MTTEDESEIARLRDAAGVLSRELAADRKQLARVGLSRDYLRSVLAELAEEVGTAEEDIGGIVEAVKQRDSAWHRMAAMRITVEALTAQRDRIGVLCGSRQDESIEAAVERLVVERAANATWTVAETVAAPEASTQVIVEDVEPLKQKIAILESHLHSIARAVKARTGETALSAVERICTLFEPPEA